MIDEEFIYTVVQCCSCDEISFRYDQTDESMVDYDVDSESLYQIYRTKIYPEYVENHSLIDGSAYIPKKVRELYVESVKALSADCPLLAVAGFRAIVEAICVELGIKKTSIVDKINQLKIKEYITKKETERLHAVRFMGNDSIHITKTPKPTDLVVVLRIIEHLLESLFIIDKRISLSKIETIISNYEDFIILLSKQIKHEAEDKTLPLKKILGVHTRRLEGYYEEYERRLIEDIKREKIQFLQLGQFTKFNGQKKEVQLYIIPKSE